jgi:hypothetical protein
MLEYQDEQVEPFRVTPGFIAFLGLLFLPMIVALLVFLGAWAYAGEVNAAEARAGETTAQGFNTVSDHEVAGWKKTLVRACPIH